MAKKYKMPKRPKASAPISTWEKYEARVKEVQKKNSALEADKKKKDAIMKRTASK